MAAIRQLVELEDPKGRKRMGVLRLVPKSEPFPTMREKEPWLGWAWLLGLGFSALVLMAVAWGLKAVVAWL